MRQRTLQQRTQGSFWQGNQPVSREGRSFTDGSLSYVRSNESVRGKAGNRFPQIVSCLSFLFNGYTEKADSYKGKSKRAHMEHPDKTLWSHPVKC